MTRRTLPILLLLALSLAWAAPATARQPDLYETMILEVIKNGRLDACKYTQEQLKAAKNATPVDGNQYSGSFVAAVDDAIAARAQGGCNDKKPGSQAPPVAGAAPPAGAGQAPPPTGAAAGAGSAAPATAGTPAAAAQAKPPPTPTAEPTPAPAISADNSIALASDATDVATDTPFPVLALAILAGLLALSALAFGLVRWFAWEPAWAGRLRHAAGEAGWRASSTFAEFGDFVRLGR